MPMKYAPFWLGCLFLAQGLSATEALVEKVTMIYPLALTGTLNVRNVDGSIMIYGWNRPEVQIIATKNAYTEQRLKGITFNVTASANSLAVDTVYPRRKGLLGDLSGTVDYVILAPASAKVDSLRLSSGEIWIEGMRGRVSADVAHGSITTLGTFADMTLKVEIGVIETFYSWWEDKAFTVNLQCHDGNIHAMIPENASLRYSMKAFNGDVKSDFHETSQNGELTGENQGEGAIGDGKSRFDLGVKNGSIWIERQ